MSVLPQGGGGVGLAEFQGGWVSNHPALQGWGGTLWGPLGLSSQCQCQGNARTPQLLLWFLVKRS